MRVIGTPLDGLVAIDTEPAGDDRGRFERLFCVDEWAAVRRDLRFVQVNLSTTAQRGTIRGMHFQRPPVAEAKLIRCVSGHAYDVAVDLRVDSPTFLRWHAVDLRADEPREFFIPEGFAHGFQAMTDDVHLLYFHTAAYAPEHEGGVRFDDPRLSIDWPLEPNNVSERDKTHALIDETFEAIRV